MTDGLVLLRFYLTPPRWRDGGLDSEHEGVGREDGQRPRASGGGHQADREKLRKLNGRRTSFVRQGGDSGGPGQST